MHMDHGLAAALHSAIASLDVIDCHEHTFLPDQRPQPMDLWSVLRRSDLGDDLIAAGLPAAERPLLDWARASPYLRPCAPPAFIADCCSPFAICSRLRPTT
jgi:hypothetical protein